MSLNLNFQKLLNATDEINKTCSVGEVEENMSKNRSNEIIPYDRNRVSSIYIYLLFTNALCFVINIIFYNFIQVILSPIPMRDNSTYINASFIEGYDNTESFIIAQDPMENTIGDFWRMISEQSVSTLIMISEVSN